MPDTEPPTSRLSGVSADGRVLIARSWVRFLHRLFNRASIRNRAVVGSIPTCGSEQLEGSPPAYGCRAPTSISSEACRSLPRQDGGF